MAEKSERGAFEVLAGFVGGLMQSGQPGSWQAVEALDQLARARGLKVTVSNNDGTLFVESCRRVAHTP